LIRCTWIALGLALAWVTPGLADDPPKTDPPKQRESQNDAKAAAKKFADAKDVMAAKEAAFNKIIQDLRAKGEKVSLENKTLYEAFEARNKSTQEAVEAGKALLKADPKAAEDFELLSQLLNMGGPSPEIIGYLAKHHVSHPKIGDLCNRLSFGPAGKETQELLRAVIEKNPDRNAKGHATMTLAQILMRTKGDEAEKLFEKVLADYKDVKWFRGTLGERAENCLFELRHLQVGMVVPDIEGEDLDGKKFKLSDYRGKVVMLDFWGHW
jgi:hypothetical protein